MPRASSSTNAHRRRGRSVVRVRVPARVFLPHAVIDALCPLPSLSRRSGAVVVWEWLGLCHQTLQKGVVEHHSPPHHRLGFECVRAALLRTPHVAFWLYHRAFWAALLGGLELRGLALAAGGPHFARTPSLREHVQALGSDKGARGGKQRSSGTRVGLFVLCVGVEAVSEGHERLQAPVAVHDAVVADLPYEETLLLWPGYVYTCEDIIDIASRTHTHTLLCVPGLGLGFGLGGAVLRLDGSHAVLEHSHGPA
jgi:hypothetical protein